MPVTLSIGDPILETEASSAHAVISTRMGGILRDAVCDPSAESRSLSLRRHHVLFDGDDFGVRALHSVELAPAC